MTVKGLAGVGANAGAGAEELIDQNGFSFFPLDLVADLNNFQGKGL